MAKYTINYACGHTGTEQLYGPGKGRESYVEWAEANKLCPECWQAKRDAERESANQAAAESNASAGLPALTGSDKQIAWAESIRKPVAETLLRLDGLSRDHAAAHLSEQARGEVRDAVALIVSEVLGHTDARWWIDHRDYLSNFNLADKLDLSELTTDHRAREWVTRQVAARGLAPTAAADCARETERRCVEAKAKAERVAEIARTVRVDEGTVESDRHGNPIAIRDGAVEITFAAGQATVREGGDVLAGRVSLGYVSDQDSLCHAHGKAMEVAARARDARQRAERDALLASLAGVTVASAQRTKKRSEPNLIVTLSDGRVAKGWHVKSEGRLEITSINGKTVPADHADVARLAAAAVEVLQWTDSTLAN